MWVPYFLGIRHAPKPDGSGNRPRSHFSGFQVAQRVIVCMCHQHDMRDSSCIATPPLLRQLCHGLPSLAILAQACPKARCFYVCCRLVQAKAQGEGLVALSPLCSNTLSGPNRAMQPRCAMRFESHIPKSLAMRKVFFASDAKTHSLDDP